MMGLNNRDITVDGVSVGGLEQYLAANGWFKRELPVSASVWSWRKFQILVPHDQSYADYRQRLEDALEILSSALAIDREDLVDRILGRRVDIVKFRAEVQTDERGSIALPAGLEFLKGIESAVKAASRASSGDRRAYYRNAGQRQVDRYLSASRLGQTEAGSFVVTIVSALSDSVDEEEGNFAFAQPFERRVNVTLAQAISRARSSALALQSGRRDALYEAINSGVSCELYGAMVQLTNSASAVEVSVDPTALVPWPDAAPKQARFDADDRGMFAAAAERLAGTQVRYLTLVGRVDGLVRHDRRRPGVAIVFARIPGQEPGKVRIELAPEDYEVAISAHQRGWFVRIAGWLSMAGSYRWLREASNVQMIPPDDPLIADE